MYDYILESADVTNVSIDDIELTQLFAEMAVLEAMMDCYEKQIALMEYNEESAEEIFIESSTSDPSIPATVAQKNLGNNIKKALSHAGAIIVKLFSSIMGAITSQKFQTLKKSLEKYEMGAEWYGPQLTDFELGYLTHLQNLDNSIDDATKYLEKARNVKTEKEANDLSKNIKKSAIEIIDKNIYKSHDEEEDRTLTHAKMKDLCDYLTNKEIIGKLNNLRYNTAKWNTDYNWVDTVPPTVGNAIRMMVKNMMTAFKFISSGLNKIIKQEVDETKKTNKQVKKIMKEDKKAKKNNKNNDSDQTDENSSDDNLEESYSMNLSEDEDFFLTESKSYSMDLTNRDYEYIEESSKSDYILNSLASSTLGFIAGNVAAIGLSALFPASPAILIRMLGGIISFGTANTGTLTMQKNLDKVMVRNFTKEIENVLKTLSTKTDDKSKATDVKKFLNANKKLYKELETYAEKNFWWGAFNKYYEEKVPAELKKSVKTLIDLCHEVEKTIPTKGEDKELMKKYLKALNDVLGQMYEKPTKEQMSKLEENIKESYVENYDDDDMILEASMMDYSNEELWVRGMPSRMIASVTAKFLKGGINGRVQLALNSWKKMYNDPQTNIDKVKRAVSNVAVQLRQYLQKVAAHEDPSDSKNTALRILGSMLEAQRTNDPNKIVIS